MAKYGLQPNGKVILEDGTEWDPNYALPASATDAFNATPMGSPLNGLGTMAPRAISADPAVGAATDPTADSSAPPLAGMPTALAMPTAAPAPSVMSGYGAQLSAASPGGVMPSADDSSAPTLGAGLATPGASDAQAPAGAATPAAPAAPTGMFAAKPAKPKFFAQGGLGQQIAGVLGPAILSASNPALAQAYLTNNARLREKQMETDAETAKYQAQLHAPKVEKVGDNLVVYRPDGQGGTQVLYHGQSEPEAYAASLGYQPGTPQYQTAMQDYALKDAGPTALGARQANWNADNARADAALAETRRQHDIEASQGAQRIGLEGQQVGIARTRVGLEGQRVGLERNNAGVVTPGKVIGPILAKVAAGQPLTPGETQTFSMYKQINPITQFENSVLGGGLGASGGPTPLQPGMRTPVVPVSPGARPSQSSGSRFTVGQTATNPRTGQKVQWSGSSWVAAR